MDEGAQEGPRPARREGWVETRRRVPSRGAVIALAVVLVVGGWLAFTARQFVRSAAVPQPSASIVGNRELLLVSPPAGVDEHRTRVLPEVTASVRSDAWRPAALIEPAGTIPVRWDPCREIRYVVRGTPPPGAETVVADAFAAVERASGLHFVAAGSTDEVPSSTRDTYQPQKYGDRWAPVLVAWVDPAAEPDVDLRPGTWWVGGTPRPTVYVTGTVPLDARLVQDLLVRPDGGASARAAVLASVARLAGLDSVDSAGQLMTAGNPGDVTDFGPGDLAGLAEMGKGPCAPWL